MENSIRLSKPLKIQTLIVVCFLFAFIILGMYCVVFQLCNDNVKNSYDLTYLKKIYAQDSDLFNSCAEWSNENDVLEISHSRGYFYEPENIVLNNTLYYEFSRSDKQLNNYYDVEKLFDIYDFDVVKKDRNKIWFRYLSPSIQLVYSKKSMKDCEQISDCWYVGYLE